MMRFGLVFAAIAVFAFAQTTGQNGAVLEENAERLFEAQRWSDAASAAEAALQADPSRVNAHVILGLIATREANPTAASRHFEKAAALRPSDPPIAS